MILSHVISNGSKTELPETKNGMHIKNITKMGSKGVHA